MFPQGIGKQLRVSHLGIQSKWKTVILIVFLSVNSLALLIFSSPWKPSSVTDVRKLPVPKPELHRPDTKPRSDHFHRGKTNGEHGHAAKSRLQYVEDQEYGMGKDDVFGYDVSEYSEDERADVKDSIKISLPHKGVLNYDLQFIHNPEHLCRGQQLSLIIGVCSAVQKFDLREAIRKTWGITTAKKHLAVKVVFVLGSLTKGHMHLQNIVDEESQRYEDIVQPELIDHYTNLSLKTLALFHWVDKYCPGVKFVAKADDDIFVNIPNMLSDLNKMAESGSKFMMGHMIQGARPITDRNDKWYTPASLFPGRTYPTYLSGSMYVFPQTLIPDLLHQTKQTDYFWLEDIYITGMLAKDIGATLVSNSKFLFKKSPLSPCSYKLVIVGHEVTHADMYKIWKGIHRPDLDCSTVDLHFAGHDVFTV